MIEIEGPDGVIYEFPEGTSEETMRTAMQGVYGAPQQTDAMQSGLAELSALSQPEMYEPSWGETAVDAVQALGAGVGRGAAALAGLPGTLGNAMDAGLTYAGQSIGIIPDDWQAPVNPLNSGNAVEALGAITGGASDYRGDTTVGQYAGTVGEMLPGAAAFGGASLGNMMTYGVAPGVASEAAGQATAGTSAEPYARTIAALLAGPAAQGLSNLGRRVISPNGGADLERLALAKILDDSGVPVSAGQRVGNEALRRKEGLSTAGRQLAGDQAEAFTEAALKTAGINAKRATPEVMAKAADDIGQVFDDVVRGVDVVPDIAQAQKAMDASALARELSPDKLPPLLKNVENRLLDAATGGAPISASTLKQWRSNLSKLTKSSDAATREGAASMMEAVDDAMATTLTNLGRADDVARLSQARADYRNFLALEKAATSAGENAASGLISPSALRSAVKTQGASSYARGGRGDIGALARAGEGVLKALPDSGTPAGLAARVDPRVITALMGSGAATAGGAGLLASTAAGLGAAAAPAIVGAARMTPLVQRYLANQAVAAPSVGMVNARALSPIASALLNLQGNE